MKLSVYDYFAVHASLMKAFETNLVVTKFVFFLALISSFLAAISLCLFPLRLISTISRLLALWLDFPRLFASAFLHTRLVFRWFLLRLLSNHSFTMESHQCHILCSGWWVDGDVDNDTSAARGRSVIHCNIRNHYINALWGNMFLPSTAKTTSCTSMKICTCIVWTPRSDQKAFSQPSY